MFAGTAIIVVIGGFDIPIGCGNSVRYIQGDTVRFYRILVMFMAIGKSGDSKAIITMRNFTIEEMRLKKEQQELIARVEPKSKKLTNISRAAHDIADAHVSRATA